MSREEGDARRVAFRAAGIKPQDASVAPGHIGYDYVNLLVHHQAAIDRVELLVNVPLVDGSVAETKITLGAPAKLARGDGEFDYTVKVDTNLNVTQTAKKASGRIDLVSRDGLYWEIPPGYPGAMTALLEHEAKVKQFLTSHFKQDHVFVDVGANVGAYTVRAAAHGMKVHAFEPNPENMKILKRNAELNEVSVDTLEYALGSVEGKVSMFPNGATSRIVDGEGIEVPVRTLDSFQLPRVDLLKVDVEGYELEVLRGAEQTLARCHPVMMVEMHHWIGAEAEASLFNILLGAGYRFEYLDTYNQGRHLIANHEGHGAAEPTTQAPGA